MTTVLQIKQLLQGNVLAYNHCNDVFRSENGSAITVYAASGVMCATPQVSLMTRRYGSQETASVLQ